MSLLLYALPATIRCPVDEIGRNSVKPSIIPSNIESKILILSPLFKSVILAHKSGNLSYFDIILGFKIY
jgi:hypothetical protein